MRKRKVKVDIDKINYYIGLAVAITEAINNYVQQNKLNK